MAVAGVPQWFAARGPITYDSTTVGSNNESAFCAMAGLDQGGTAVATWAAGPSQGHTITGGPTTTTPVLVTENGVTWAGPYNVVCTMPNWVFKAMAAGSMWTVT